MARDKVRWSYEELKTLCAAPPDTTIKRYCYKECFLSSPKLQHRIVQTECISDAIAILEALGEGTLMVSTKTAIERRGISQWLNVTLKN